MYRPARQKTNRGSLGQIVSRPAPIGGLNARDSLSDMDPQDAIVMTNFFPETSDVRLRKGYSSYATGLGTYVETLAQYASATTKKCFAAAGSNVYDVSSSGAVGAAVLTGKTNARWQHINMGTSGGQFLLMFNGADDPVNYNGSAWATSPAITGVTPANLISANVFKDRIFAIEKNTMKAWYLGTAAIGGAANALNFSSIFKLGGSLMAMGTWSLDAGYGADDHAVFITSEGEIAVYRGTDPSSATTWALVGVFRVGRPLGRRCFIKMGGDLVIITTDGFLPLSKALISGRVSNTYALSDKIVKAVNSDALMHGDKFGWQGILYPEGQMAVFNVPTQENASAVQYVMNTATGSWGRFTGWNANCFELYNEDLYFGGNGTVYKAWDGLNDADADIQGEIKTAFDYFGARSQVKRFTMARPMIAADGELTPAMEMCVDFEDRVPTSTATFSSSSGSVWDDSPWDTTDWGDGGIISKQWQSIQGVGICGALKIKMSANNMNVYLNAIDYRYEPGGSL